MIPFSLGISCWRYLTGRKSNLKQLVGYLMISTRYYCHDEVTSFNVLAGLLRLSTKYRVKYLRDRVLRHLSTVCPDTLQDYLARTEKETLVQGENSADFNVDLIILANECLSQQLLPFSFYWAAIYKLDMDFRSYPPDENWEETSGYDRLPYADLARISYGAQRLQRAMNRRIGRSFQETPSHLCLDPVARATARKLTLEDEIWSEWKQLGEVFDPNLVTNIGDLVDGLCAACNDHMENAVENERREIWEELPSYFDLQDWTTLRESSKTLIVE